MNRLPLDFDGAVFVGRELTSVSVYSNQLIFQFGSGAFVRVEAGYSVGDGPLHAAPIFDPLLAAALDKKVARVEVGVGQTLRFAFEGGLAIVFHDDARFEAYHVGWPGHELHV